MRICQVSALAAQRRLSDRTPHQGGDLPGPTIFGALMADGCPRSESGRRGWLTPVLPHHRSCGPASGGSVVGTRHHDWLDTRTLGDSVIPSVTHLSSGGHPLDEQLLSPRPNSYRAVLPATAGPFPPSAFTDFSGTMAQTDFCGFSHASQHGLHLTVRIPQTSPLKVQ